MHKLAQLDHEYLWHPFTQMQDWLKSEPIVITSGHGSMLRDARGRTYLDANSSIWTNLHGHGHPALNRAIERQLQRIAHSSALGFANEPASLLARDLVTAAKPVVSAKRSPFPNPKSSLRRVFFSDNGSTALEVALKMAYEVTRRERGPKSSPRFLSLTGGYHGDTVGAVSLGHIDLFHKAYQGLLFKTDQVMAPYCYRCPFNRAKPERADARIYRKCNWECVGKVEQTLARRAKRSDPYAGFIFEPLMQGAAGMIPQPDGWLNRVTDLARAHGALLIADEVMTGFGRTGITEPITKETIRELRRGVAPDPLFATTRAGVPVDFLCLAKGLTGGYVPMAATLTTQRVFDAFLGKYEEFKTFFHGHSFTGNQIGAAAGLASLKLLNTRASRLGRARLQKAIADALPRLWAQSHVGDIRQVGLVTGIELVRDWRTREPYDLRQRAGIRVCEALARRGVLTRPIGNVIALLPPYCTTEEQVQFMVDSMLESCNEVLGR